MTDRESPFIFVLPGGAYEFLAEYEGEPVSRWLRSAGFSSAPLAYPVAPAKYPEARDFVSNAIAEKRREFTGPIGLLGFSAGAHLAGTVALDPSMGPASGPDFVGLSYPVVEIGESGHKRSRLALLGADADSNAGSAHSLTTLVSRAAPPFFIWHTADDEMVPASHSLNLSLALAAIGVPVELHVFPHGPHGLGLAEESKLAFAWTSLFEAWLRALPSLS